MVGEPCEIDTSAFGQLLQYGKRPAVQRKSSVRIDRLLQREPRELVPERDALVLVPEDPRRETLVELGQRAVREELQQPQRDALTELDDGLEKPACIGAEPGSTGEDGVADRGRHVRHSRRERL